MTHSQTSGGLLHELAPDEQKFYDDGAKEVEDEIKKINKRMGIKDPKHDIDFAIGEVVNIIDGPFKGFDGAISEIDNQKGKVKVMVSMFGRDTSVELDALQVQKVS